MENRELLELIVKQNQLIIEQNDLIVHETYMIEKALCGGYGPSVMNERLNKLQVLSQRKEYLSNYVNSSVISDSAFQKN